MVLKIPKRQVKTLTEASTSNVPATPWTSICLQKSDDIGRAIVHHAKPQEHDAKLSQALEFLQNLQPYPLLSLFPSML